MLRPDGRQRQSDQDSNRDFDEAVKRDDPCSVRTAAMRSIEINRVAPRVDCITTSVAIAAQ